jgi:hypothetical protein
MQSLKMLPGTGGARIHAVREELQDLGQHLVDSDPVSLCRAGPLGRHFSPGENLRVDGIRHAAVYRPIVEIVKPSRPCLIHLRASDDVRFLRAAERGDPIAGAADQRVEAELATALPAIADAVVDTSGSFAKELSDCLDVLGRFGVDETLISSAREYARDCP